MTEKEFYKKIYRRIAQVSIGASAIRNQGGSGLIDILRDYFENDIDPKIFFNVLSNRKKYSIFLDEHTYKIVSRFPKNAKSWGAARKGLNLFFRDLVYNRFFSQRYGVPMDYLAFNEFIQHMEVPLDNDVVAGLVRDSKIILPKWMRIKNLTPEISEIYQKQATLIAVEKKTARINLDLIYWRGGLNS